MESDQDDQPLCTARRRLEKLKARVHLTEQQIECFSQEVVWTLEKLTLARLALTPEMCRSLSRESLLLAEVEDKLMVLLEIKDRSRPTFEVRITQALIKDFDQLKMRMTEVTPELMTEEQLSALLPIWQLHQSGCAGLSPAGAALCLYIALCVEVKLKSETRAIATRRLPRLQRKLSDQRSLMASLEAEDKELIDCSEIDEKMCSDLTGVTGDFSRAVVIEERTIGVRHLRHGTASGGVLSRTAHSMVQSSDFSFPDFDRQDLYQERPPEEDEWEVALEGEREGIRLCGSRFFCM